MCLQTSTSASRIVFSTAAVGLVQCDPSDTTILSDGMRLKVLDELRKNPKSYRCVADYVCVHAEQAIALVASPDGVSLLPTSPLV
jgi:hypothetical protein